jgi:acetyltransferase-like isoleucine patch superfamily enzyme
METTTESEVANTQKEIIKEEIKLQFHWYLLTFFLIYLGSWLISGIIFIFFVLQFFLPYFLDNPSFISLFTELYPFLSLILMPLVIIACYLIHLFVVALITRLFWIYTEKKSPSKPGIIPRNVPSKVANFYHIRSFMIKYGKNAFIKGPFPYLANWFFNFVGTNKIGKGSTIEEQVVGGKFAYVGKNCYVGVNSALSTHFVEGIFGNIVYFPIKLGNNVTLSAFNNIAPGCELADDTYVLPMGAATKFNKTKGNNFYFGMPIRKIFKKKIMNYLEITPEDLKKAEELRQSREKQMNENKNIKTNEQ